MAERVLVGAGVGNGVGSAPVFRLLDRSQRELSNAIGQRHSLSCIRDSIHAVADEIEQASGREEVDAVMSALGCPVFELVNRHLVLLDPETLPKIVHP